MLEARRLFQAARLLAVCAGLSILALPGAADVAKRARTGFFLSVLGVRTSLGGDMNGRSVIDYGQEAFLVPRINGAWGYGLGLGRREEAFSQEISFYQIEHEAIWKDAVLKATTHWLEYIPRFYLSTKSAVQPFASLGLSYMWLDAEDCVSRGAKVDAATYYGLGLNLSGGLSLYLHPRLAFHGSGGYRILMVGRVKGAGGKANTIQETVWADGPSFSGGLTLTF